jgi:hypothetical protein
LDTSKEFEVASKDYDDDDDEFEVVNQEEVEAVARCVHAEYIMNTENRGTTLMWHGIPNKWSVSPELFDALEALNARDVGMVYMPLGHWERRHRLGVRRNKGYAFVHFLTVEAAKDFAAAVATQKITEKAASTTLATYQGISANLRTLMQMTRKRSNTGTIFVLADGGLKQVHKKTLGRLCKGPASK